MADITFGTMGQYSSTVTYFWSCKLDATHYVIAYQNTFNSNGYAVIASVSGTTIAYGTAVSFITSCKNAPLSVSCLDSTHFVVCYQDNNTGYDTAVVGVTDGSTTITSYGTPVQMSAFSTNGSMIGSCALDSTHFATSYRQNGDSNSYVVVGSVSGTTITAGTPVVFGGTTNPTNSPIPLTTIDSTHFLCAYNTNSSFTGKAFVCSVSGTTITKGTDVTFSTGYYAYLSAFTIDSTHVGLSFERIDTVSFNEYLTSLILTTSGTTISSVGSTYDNGGTYGGSANISSNAVDSTHFIVSYNDGSSIGASVLATISGGVISYGSAVEFDTQSIRLVSSTIILDSTHIAIAWVKGTDITAQTIIGVVSISTSANSNFLQFM